jgi:uncharacterized membrane protein YeaQ/YmgE (transglycosylase-associated protein family)
LRCAAALPVGAGTNLVAAVEVVLLIGVAAGWLGTDGRPGRTTVPLLLGLCGAVVGALVLAVAPLCAPVLAAALVAGVVVVAGALARQRMEGK